MLNKKNRLAKDSEIKAVFARGRAFFNPFFTVKFMPVAGIKRFAVVVSTKVNKSAAKRNRIKRLVREYLKKNLPEIKSGTYAIVAKPKISQATEDEMLKALVDTFKKIK